MLVEQVVVVCQVENDAKLSWLMMMLKAVSGKTPEGVPWCAV